MGWWRGKDTRVSAPPGARQPRCSLCPGVRFPLGLAGKRLAWPVLQGAERIPGQADPPGPVLPCGASWREEADPGTLVQPPGTWSEERRMEAGSRLGCSAGASWRSGLCGSTDRPAERCRGLSCPRMPGARVCRGWERLTRGLAEMQERPSPRRARGCLQGEKGKGKGPFPSGAGGGSSCSPGWRWEAQRSRSFPPSTLRPQLSRPTGPALHPRAAGSMQAVPASPPSPAAAGGERSGAFNPA